jgi:hypothetical protein
MAATDHRARHDAPADQADVVVRSFRRLSWQRIEVRADGTGRGVVTGLRHRLPTSLEVSLPVARELQRRGLRTVTNRVG